MGGHKAQKCPCPLLASSFMDECVISNPNPAMPCLRIYPREMKTYVCAKISTIWMFIAASFTIAKRWKQPKCPPMDDWRNKIWSIHIMQYYWAINRSEALIHCTTWTKLENTMLSGKKASHKGLHIILLHLHEMSKTQKSIETESRIVVA